MLGSSLKKQAVGASILTVIWATTLVEPVLGPAKQEDISIGYASPSGVMTPLYVAQEQGLFKKHGLGVKELLLLRGTGPAAAQIAELFVWKTSCPSRQISICGAGSAHQSRSSARAR